MASSSPEHPSPRTSTELRAIKREIVKIRKAVKPRWQIFLLRGVLHGSGFIIGTVFTIALAGILLNAFGIIPGLGAITDQLEAILDARTRVPLY